MASRNLFLTIAGGALPGRNPGRRTVVAYFFAARFSKSATGSTGTFTSMKRSRPSLRFGVISIFIPWNLITFPPLSLASRNAVETPIPGARRPHFGRCACCGAELAPDVARGGFSPVAHLCRGQPARNPLRHRFGGARDDRRARRDGRV